MYKECTEMPRKPRFILPGQPQHVIIRGVNREPIFLRNMDYHYYLKRLREAAEKNYCAIHAYVLMTNHVHLLITPEDSEGISKAIQVLGRYYVQYFNKTQNRTGTLWEGRYKSTPVDSEHYLLTCYRYIELNPVRANMVTHPADYPWSSYHHNASGQPNDIITRHSTYHSLGDNDKERQQSYRDLFKQEIDEEKLEEIRIATNREWVLGNENFKSWIERKLQRRTKPLPRGGDRKSIAFKSRKRINRH
jgi:putative transposase